MVVWTRARWVVELRDTTSAVERLRLGLIDEPRKGHAVIAWGRSVAARLRPTRLHQMVFGTGLCGHLPVVDQAPGAEYVDMAVGGLVPGVLYGGM